MYRIELMFALDGYRILNSIDKTIEKYQNKTASDLVEITHRVGSPWDIKHNNALNFLNDEISDKLILEHHSVEVL